MKLIKPSFNVLDNIDALSILSKIEYAGRQCYQSDHKIGPDTHKQFVKRIIDNGHHSVLEHEKVSVEVVCDRGVTHEIVRHRIASYSQESTRYCDYGDGHMVFIIPPWTRFEEGVYVESFDLKAVEDSENKSMHLSDYYWFNHMMWCERTYKFQRKHGWSPQEARSVLPNSLKTDIVMTMNLREWRHFFKLRTDTRAHPQMREVAQPMLDRFKELIPIVFDDITYKEVK